MNVGVNPVGEHLTDAIGTTWKQNDNFKPMNISDNDGPLSTNIIIVLIADEINKADQTAWRK